MLEMSKPRELKNIFVFMLLEVLTQAALAGNREYRRERGRRRSEK